MRGLGKSSALRIAAVFVLLALRPSMIALGAALLNDFSDAHASFQYISDDLEAHQLRPARQVWSQRAPAQVHFSGLHLVPSGQRFCAPGALCPISESGRGIVLNARSAPHRSRSPPLHLS